MYNMEAVVNSKERLTRIFQGKEIDRPALKLWGTGLGQRMIHKAYKPVYDLAIELSDIMESVSSKFDIMLGSGNDDLCSIKEQALPGTNWVDRYKYIQLPDRKLSTKHRYSTIGEPGYTLEYLIKEPDDLKALINLSYQPYEINTQPYYERQKILGNKGIVLFNIDHPAYAIIRSMGSECFGLMSFDERELIHEAVNIYSDRILNHVKAVLSTGLTPIFGWVGPELCTPPLTRMLDFEEFVYSIDKKVCDLIHNAGGYVWVHCHGSVGKLLTRFIDMGVDVLNPIEPPPQGDITLSDAIKIVGNDMGLEGNIEISSLLLEKQNDIEQIIDQAIYEGKESNRFILCPSAGYMEYVNPTPQYINNLMIYLKRGNKVLTNLEVNK